jgi:hypothetical protein
MSRVRVQLTSSVATLETRVKNDKAVSCKSGSGD